MNRSDTEIVVALIGQVLINGPALVLSAIAAFDREDWTAEDIRALKIDKKPEDFFNEPE